GSEPERPYDEITELAAQVAQCPASIISFMDDSHLWPKAHHGMPPNRAPLPREMFMCSTAAAGADLLIIEDLTKDSRFAHLPVVSGPPHLRFYCGMPLINPQGHSLGSLCVVDFKPRGISFEQGEALRRLGPQVVTLLELRRSLLQLQQTKNERQDQREK